MYVNVLKIRIFRNIEKYLFKKPKSLLEFVLTTKNEKNYYINNIKFNFGFHDLAILC